MCRLDELMMFVDNSEWLLKLFTSGDKSISDFKWIASLRKNCLLFSQATVFQWYKKVNYARIYDYIKTPVSHIILRTKLYLRIELFP